MNSVCLLSQIPLIFSYFTKLRRIPAEVLYDNEYPQKLGKVYHCKDSRGPLGLDQYHGLSPQ